jgi:DNA-binding beta-propeller fold protein YncE
MWLDPTLGALFVGHLTVVANNLVQGGGVSSIDICDPQNVRFAGHTDATFLPQSLSQSVASLSPGDPANVSSVVYAGAQSSAAISGLALQSPRIDCVDVAAGAPDRDLTLVAADSFYSSAFLPHGADIRGILFSDDGSKAWVLHKNDASISTSPAALVAIDRRRTGWNGEPADTPIDFVQVCGGPTEMQMHDAGRGNRIFITCYDTGQVYVVDPIYMTVTAIIDVGAGPTSLVFSPTEAKAYVASFFNSHLSVIDFAPGSRTENHVILRMGLPHGYGQ